MKTIITDTATLLLNGGALSLIVMIMTSAAWYFVLRPVRERDIKSALPDHIAEEFRKKDQVIRDKNVEISRLSQELRAEKNRNRAMTEAAHVVTKIGSAPYAEYF